LNYIIVQIANWAKHWSNKRSTKGSTKPNMARAGYVKDW